MADKIMKSRIVHKHDVEANWLLATNFSPMLGELVLYDKDSTHDYVRFKVGDGSTNVNDLPFVDAYSMLDERGQKIYYGTEAPTDGSDVWINPNGTDDIITAYDAAQAGGYTGTETDFYADLAAMDGLAAQLAAI